MSTDEPTLIVFVVIVLEPEFFELNELNKFVQVFESYNPTSALSFNENDTDAVDDVPGLDVVKVMLDKVGAVLSWVYEIKLVQELLPTASVAFP